MYQNNLKPVKIASFSYLVQARNDFGKLMSKRFKQNLSNLPKAPTESLPLYGKNVLVGVETAFVELLDKASEVGNELVEGSVLRLLLLLDVEGAEDVSNGNRALECCFDLQEEDFDVVAVVSAGDVNEDGLWCNGLVDRSSREAANKGDVGCMGIVQIDLLVVLYLALVKLLVEGALLFAEGKTVFAMRGVEWGIEVAGVFKIDGELVELNRDRDKMGNSMYITNGVMIVVAGFAMCLEDVVDSAMQLLMDAWFTGH